MKELSLKEIQNHSLEILMDIDEVCRNNSIKYCIVFGTLIGAIRHKGFIPWDDDIDIAMTRENYNTFLSVYKKVGKFRIVNSETEPKCPYMITRISDDHFKLESLYGSDYNIGTFVDIYPYDGIGKGNDSINRIVKMSSCYSKRLSRSLEKNPFRTVKNLHRGLKKWLLLPTFVIPKLIGADYYRKRLRNLTEQYSYSDSDYVGCAIWMLIKKECFKKKWIEDIIDIKFEDKTIMAPRYYDEMLRCNFGDYMQLPPEDERVGHHFYKIYER